MAYGRRTGPLCIGACFVLCGLAATLIGVLGASLPIVVQPLILVVVLTTAMLLVTPVAMAGIATIFGDLRERPFVKIGWRGVARAVIGDTGENDTRRDAALYVAWVRTAVRRYLATSRATRGNGAKNMLTFVDLFRHGGATTAPARLEAMALVLPTRAFATMAFAQLGALLLPPAGALLVMLGMATALSISPSRAMPLLVLAGGLAFTTALFLQLFIALVDVMLYDLAYDMTEA